MTSVLRPTLKGTAFKVLLVEDNIAAAELIQELLLEANEVRVPLRRVKRVSEAIEALDREDFDAILLDLSLPDGKWLDTIATLNEYACIGKTRACPPIVVLSAVDDEDLALRAIQAGAQDYLVKGKFESKLLIRSLRYAIARQVAAESLQQSEQNYYSVVDKVRAEEALFKQERQFRTITENSPDVITRFDRELRYLYVNPAFEQATGIPSQSVIGKTNQEVGMPSEQSSLWNVNLQNVFDTARSKCHEFDFPTPSGELKTYQARLVPEFSNDGEVEFVLVVSRDITELKQTQEALRNSEEKFRQMAQSIRECFWMSDAEMSQVLYVSPAYEEIWGRSCQSVYECIDTWLEAVHPDDRQRQTNAWESLSQGEMVETEYRVIRPDGSIVWVLDRTFPVRNERGEIYRLAGIVLNISDRKQTESVLQQQKELLQTIFDHIPVMVSFYDANGRLQLVNRELESVLGWSLAELGNRDMLAFCYPNPKYRQKVVNFTLAATGKWQDFKTRTRDGRVLDTCWAGIRLGDGTRIGIGQDITERKRTEEALHMLTQQERERALQLEQALNELQHTQAQLVQNEKMASLGQLVAGVAHEINNPVSFIYGNVTPALAYTCDLLHLISLYQQHYPRPPAQIQDEIEAIELDFIKQDFPKLLRSMQEGASRIREIVLSLRHFSRLNEAERKEADLHKGLESTLMLLGSRLKEQPNRAAIQVIKEYGDLPLVDCYPSELNQVFMNILSNAIDALEERLEEDSSLTPQILISTEVLRGTGDWVHWSSYDSEAGRSPEGQGGQGGQGGQESDFSSPPSPPTPP